MIDVREERSIPGLRAGFLQFAETVFAPQSASLYERLALGVADSPELLALAAEVKVGQYPAYVLFAAVHYLLLADPVEPLATFYATLRGGEKSLGDPFPLFQELCMRRGEEILALVTTRMVQTNEVGRSASLAPAFAFAARLAGNAPLHLIDVGAAAGLNLLFDRYHLRYGRIEWGDTTSPVKIACDLQDDAGLPLAGWTPNFCHRVGLDLSPIDVTSESDARWLKACVWPEQPGRAEVLRSALTIASQDPPKLLQGDILDLLPGVLGGISAAEIPCVFQSYTLEYLPEESRAEFFRTLDRFGTERDLYFVDLSGHPLRAHVGLTSWRNGVREDLQLAECAGHGQWLKWLA